MIAENPQTVPIMLVFRGKPSAEDPSIPKSGKLLKEIKHYDPRTKVCWDPKAWMNEPQCQFEAKEKAQEKKETRFEENSK